MVAYSASNLSTSGVQLRFSTAPDIPEFERRLAAGVYDFVYINPYHYTVLHNTSAYEAFAKQANQKPRGILVGAKDSDWDDVRSLGWRLLDSLSRSR